MDISPYKELSPHIHTLPTSFSWESATSMRNWLYQYVGLSGGEVRSVRDKGGWDSIWTYRRDIIRTNGKTSQRLAWECLRALGEHQMRFEIDECTNIHYLRRHFRAVPSMHENMM